MRIVGFAFPKSHDAQRHVSGTARFGPMPASAGSTVSDCYPTWRYRDWVCGCGNAILSLRSPSRWNSIASLIARAASFTVRPVATHPSMSGEYADNPVAVSSMTTRYFMVSIEPVSSRCSMCPQQVHRSRCPESSPVRASPHACTDDGSRVSAPESSRHRGEAVLLHALSLVDYTFLSAEHQGVPHLLLMVSQASHATHVNDRPSARYIAVGRKKINGQYSSPYVRLPSRTAR